MGKGFILESVKQNSQRLPLINQRGGRKRLANNNKKKLNGSWRKGSAVKRKH